jgi:hypothetical protein
MAVSTEQHRLANLKLETQSKSMARDIETQTKLHAEALQSKESETNLLSAKIEAHAAEAKRLQGRIKATADILSAHPVDLDRSARAKNILASSVEILELAHAKGSAESMRQCLGQVAEVLKDLHWQMSTQHRLFNAWLDQVNEV